MNELLIVFKEIQREMLNAAMHREEADSRGERIDRENEMRILNRLQKRILEDLEAQDSAINSNRFRTAIIISRFDVIEDLSRFFFKYTEARLQSVRTWAHDKLGQVEAAALYLRTNFPVVPKQEYGNKESSRGAL